VWQTQNLIGGICSIPFVVIVGKIADKVSAKILIPGSLVFQIIVMVAYCFVTFPTEWLAYFLSVF
jgi:hypothetical protein